MKEVALIALGNRLCGDDGVGPAILDRMISESLPDWVEPIWLENDWRGLEYLDEHYHKVIILDAVDFGQVAGSLACFTVDQMAAPPTWGMHLLDLSTALPRSLHRRTVILGIQPAVMDLGLGLSPRVAAARSTACGILRHYLNQWKGAGAVGQYWPLGTDLDIVGGFSGVWAQSLTRDRQGVGQGDHGV